MAWSRDIGESRSVSARVACTRKTRMCIRIIIFTYIYVYAFSSSKTRAIPLAVPRSTCLLVELPVVERGVARLENGNVSRANVVANTLADDDLRILRHVHKSEPFYDDPGLLRSSIVHF